MERNFEIKVKTTADTSGITQTQKALQSLKGEADGDVSDFLGDFGRGLDKTDVEETTAAVADLGEKLGDVTGKSQAAAAATAADSGAKVQALPSLTKYIGLISGIGTALTAAGAVLGTWLNQNKEVTEAGGALWETLKGHVTGVIDDIVKATVPGGKGLADMLDRWNVAMGGTSAATRKWQAEEKKYLEDAAKNREANTMQLEDQLEIQEGLWDKHRAALKDEYEDLDDTAKKEEELAEAEDQTAKARIDADESLSPEQRHAAKQEIDEVAEQRRFVGREESRGRQMELALRTEGAAETAYEQVAAQEQAQAKKVADMERAQELAMQAKAEERDYEDLDTVRVPKIRALQNSIREKRAIAENTGGSEDLTRSIGEDENELQTQMGFRDRAYAKMQATRVAADEAAAGIDPNASLEEERGKLATLRERAAPLREQYDAAAAQSEQIFERAGKDSAHDRAMFAEREQARQVTASAPAPDAATNVGPQIAQAGEKAAEANAEVGAAAQEMATRIVDTTSQSAGDMRRAASSIDQGFGGLQAAITDLARAVQQNAARTEQVQQQAAAALQAAADLRAAVRPMVRQ